MSSILDNLYAAIERGNAPHACFFACADRAMAERAALGCAARFCGVREAELATWPDFFDYACPVPVEALRQLLSECARRTFTEGGRCVRFTEAHLMSELGQNLLLKTLEEPPARTLFLLCGNLEGVLPTVRSRCASLRLPPPTPEDMLRVLGPDANAALYAGAADSLAQAELLCRDEAYRTQRQEAFASFRALLGGSPSYPKKGQADKAAAEDTMRFWLSFARDMLCSKYGMPPRNADLASALRDLGQRFTSGQMNCMIERLTGAIARLRTNASAGATLDVLITQILEEVRA